MFDTNDRETFTPQLTNTPVTSGKEEQNKNYSGDHSDNSEDYDSEDMLDKYSVKSTF